MVRQKAELFANGFMKGRADGMKDARRLVRNAAYMRKRIAFLAMWRKHAIDRLGIGPRLVEEIDNTAKVAIRVGRPAHGKTTEHGK